MTSRTISIHALLAESDPPRVIREPATSRFLSTLSLRRATTPLTSRITRRQYFYPRSPCGERPSRRYLAILGNAISIHALLAESDAVMDNIVFVPGEFLSTLSLRRATSRTESITTEVSHFYPRSPCGERRDVIAVMTDAQSISIHALLAESDIASVA